jgi:hypothetical protein
VSVSGSPEARRPPEDAVDVDGVEAAVVACPAVASMSAGRFGEVATYLPGRRVAGIRANDTDVEIHIVARHGYVIQHVTARIAAATRSLVGDRLLTVAVDDLDIDLSGTSSTSRNTPTRSGSEKL